MAADPKNDSKIRDQDFQGRILKNVAQVVGPVAPLTPGPLQLNAGAGQEVNVGGAGESRITTGGATATTDALGGQSHPTTPVGAGVFAIGKDRDTLIANGGGLSTANLPAANANPGRELTFKANLGNNWSIVPDGTDKVDNPATGPVNAPLALPQPLLSDAIGNILQMQGVTIKSDGVDTWWIVGMAPGLAST